MDSLRLTVIIPMRHFRPEEQVLLSLRETIPPSSGVQILVAEGEHPARQRNVALELVRGEVVVFLDNDCRLGSAYWQELEAALARPEVGIVGGPALLRDGATPLEQIFHALLTHTLLVGTVSARYAPRGSFRPANQTELILCNLAARKNVFEKIGPLSTDLYPNEENEWLDRAHAAGIGIYYSPNLQVFRPQRATWTEMGATLLRYGMGRTRQFRVSGWHPTFHQFLPLILLGTLVALVHWRLQEEFIFLWAVASVVIALTVGGNLGIGQRLVAGLVAPLVPLTYAVGQVLGWIALCFPTPVAAGEIVVTDEHGNRVS